MFMAIVRGTLQQVGSPPSAPGRAGQRQTRRPAIQVLYTSDQALPGSDVNASPGSTRPEWHEGT
jgi:hypothetical protein